jgi:hypothetical protein
MQHHEHENKGQNFVRFVKTIPITSRRINNHRCSIDNIASLEYYIELLCKEILNQC